ncbi:VOC family protein [Candidatus Leptofilum sp.]|uniref:VOC family protein n=1 Tax=Candidatus Leptofilum sp. TaxID=3241576 RepID=UPI003B59C097
MRIEHIAIWTQQLETLRIFYEKFFNGRSSSRYTNPKTGFTSYFLSFESGARLELMQRPDIISAVSPAEQMGLAHFAVSLGSEPAVDTLTKQLHEAGYQIVSQPRTTGDGYYESVALDPDGNRLELTV